MLIHALLVCCFDMALSCAISGKPMPTQFRLFYLTFNALASGQRGPPQHAMVQYYFSPSRLFFPSKGHLPTNPAFLLRRIEESVPCDTSRGIVCMLYISPQMIYSIFTLVVYQLFIKKGLSFDYSLSRLSFGDYIKQGLWYIDYSLSNTSHASWRTLL